MKFKRDMLLNVMHLQEAHLHHLDVKLEWSNSRLTDVLKANVWFSSKVTYAIDK
jgi:hypothetical protein